MHGDVQVTHPALRVFHRTRAFGSSWCIDVCTFVRCVLITSHMHVHRLHSRKRWISTTIQKFRVAKAKYFTFIHPNERLVTRKFPSQGCFAYLFREPDEPSSELDRFFPIAVIDNYWYSVLLPNWDFKEYFGSSTVLVAVEICHFSSWMFLK